MRDAIAWATFCHGATSSGNMSPWEAYAHGAYLTLLDGLGLGLGIPEATATQLRASCEAFIGAQLPPWCLPVLLSAKFAELPSELGLHDGADDVSSAEFGAGSFRITKVRAHSFLVEGSGSVRCDDEMNELQLTAVGGDVGRIVKRLFINGNLSDAQSPFCLLSPSSASGLRRRVIRSHL